MIHEKIKETEEIMSKTVGNLIKSERKRRKISQRSLAEMTGLNQQVVSRIEAGHQSTGINTVSQLAEALGGKIEITWQPKKTKC